MFSKYSLLFALCVLPGCSAIDSYAPDTQSKGAPSQVAGTYYLAKQLVQVVITTTNIYSGTTVISTDPKMETSVITVPDERSPMQLAFQLSAFADDNIKVDYENGLLKQISSVNIDRSGDIAIALSQDLALLREAPITSADTRTFTFDPYDAEDAKRQNELMQKAMGSKETCVEVEIKPGVWSAGCPESVRYGGSTATGPEVSPMSSFALGQAEKIPGIWYRRAMPRRVHAVLKGKQYSLSQLLFANAGPIYRVDIDRTAFVTRETQISFTAGEPTSVSVKKESEALAIAKLPVSIVSAYVGSLVDAFTRRANVQTARASYYNAYASRLNADVALLKAKSEHGEAFAPGGGLRSGSSDPACQLAYPLEPERCP